MDENMHSELKIFVKEVHQIISEGGDEDTITTKVENKMKGLVCHDGIIPSSHMKPRHDKYALYPLYIAPDDSFSIAVAVWDVGQKTPIHDHCTWGVIGVLQGAEREVRYERSSHQDNSPMVQTGDSIFYQGDVTVCCTSDADIHEVSCASSLPCIGLHVYGANIGVIQRHTYNKENGQLKTVVTAWDTV